MATYPAITPTNGAWSDVSAVATDRTGQAFKGNLWISDDASPNVATAQFISSGERFFIAASKAYKVTPADGASGVQLRLMDA